MTVPINELMTEDDVRQLCEQVKPLLDSALEMADDRELFDAANLGVLLHQVLRHLRRTTVWCFDPSLRDTNISREAIMMALIPARAKIGAVAKLLDIYASHMDTDEMLERVWRMLCEAQMDIAEVLACPEFQPGHQDRIRGYPPDAD
jgi:hypothetical protein